MPNTQRNFVVRPALAFGVGEPTGMKSLAELGLKKPVQAFKAVNMAFNATNRVTFRDLLMKYATIAEFDSDTMYQWNISQTAYKNIPLIEARDQDGAQCEPGQFYGKGGQIIYLLMPEKYFFAKEIIVGSLNELYQFRIISEPQAEGTNYLYECELMAGSDTGIDGRYLQNGERFSYEFLLVEPELSLGAGGVRASTPSTMFNEFSTRRKSKKFTGCANWQQELAISYDAMVRNSESGNVEMQHVYNWFTYEEWKFYDEWFDEGDRLDMFARSNRLANGTYANRGDSGNYIHEGNGVMAQMDMGNTHYYNSFGEDFDLDGLEDALYAVCTKGNVPMNQRKFIIRTGNYGMVQVHKAIQRMTNGWNIVGATEKVNAVTPTTNAAHQNAMSFGFQFTELQSPNGLIMQFILEPAYDDPVRNKIAGPNGRGVMMSYRYDIFDMGSELEPNIKLCRVKNYKSKAKYILGMDNPWGFDDDHITTSEDASSVHMKDISGVCILDPSRCLSYIPAQLRA